jgi:hypothetical protein
MREDLNKLLCERERHRHADCYGNYRHLKLFDDKYYDDDFDEPFAGVGSGHRESMKRRYGYDTKSFNENLNPLLGFIRGSLGKKWDKVYSEVCEVFDKRSVINQHILLHLFQYVELDMHVGKDGKLYVFDTYSPNRYNPLEKSSTEYYVDPRDGILKYNHKRLTYRQERRQQLEEHAKKEAAKRRVINEMLELHQEDGIWYEVEYVLPERWARTELDANGKERIVYYSQYVRDASPVEVDISKRVRGKQRQLNHKELKRYGLVNEFKKAA